ncbi:helix-turn-helix domain-containing protein [Kordiimonas lacus]|uniref:AraC family transcriptional regulator n=1 Tax=Kordiimonas lacus TaxID=637679 RepID=A0A1G7EI08_9PROT|nr:AraC family transcriptional regulator [Kordiimonas lacus]SDE63330.1 AraC family transcriptional regulator [Kordiimonas lacus]
MKAFKKVTPNRLRLFVSSTRLGGGGYPAAMTCKATHRKVTAGAISAELLPRAPYDVAYTPDRVVAGFAFDIQTGLHAFATDRASPFLTMPDSMALTPAGCDIRSRSDVGGEYLTVTITPGHEQHYADAFDGAAIYQYSNAAFKGAGTAARALRQLLILNPEEETVAEGLAAVLFEAALKAKPATAKPASSLTRTRMRRLHDLIEARFGDKLTVLEMAMEVGLSVGFFIRAFAAATGTTPHAYLLERRLSEARRSLTRPEASIADIAHACGFASQAHLTSSFRSQFGIAPAAYRTRVA